MTMGNTAAQPVDLMIPGLPPTANEQYVHARRATFLKPEVAAFRRTVAAAVGAMGFALLVNKESAYSVHVILQSDRWITQDGRWAKMDIDNRLKQLFDAIEKASGLPDKNIVAVHAVKSLGPELTKVWLTQLDL